MKIEVVDARVAKLVDEEARTWIDTPYSRIISEKGRGISCTSFIAEVAAAFRGTDSVEVPSLPGDAYFNQPHLAEEAYRTLVLLFQPCEEIRTGTLHPGDWLVISGDGGGPGHAYLVGSDRLYHASPRRGVRSAGLRFPPGHRLYKVLRAKDKEKWTKQIHSTD